MKNVLTIALSLSILILALSGSYALLHSTRSQTTQPAVNPSVSPTSNTDIPTSTIETYGMRLEACQRYWLASESAAIANAHCPMSVDTCKSYYSTNENSSQCIVTIANCDEDAKVSAKNAIEQRISDCPGSMPSNL